MLREKEKRKKLFSYGSTKPLLGEIGSDLSPNNNTFTVKRVKIYVIKEKVPSLLSRKTAEKEC